MRSDLQPAFAESELFNGFTPEAHVERFEDRESLSAYANKEDCIGLVQKGLADVWCIASDGTETLLNTARRGDCFGIAYIYEPRGMQTRVVARGRCEAAFIRKAEIKRLITESQDFAIRYYTLCNQKIQFLLGRIMLLTSQSCRTRLTAYLLLNRNADNVVPMRGTKDELASRLSVSRAALYRELGTLQKRGLIESLRQGIKLTDLEQLEQLLYYDNLKEDT